MAISVNLTNRIGFIILGLSNLSAYCIMLAAAYDLLANIEVESMSIPRMPSNITYTNAQPKNYCLKQSTGTILIANSLPGLLMKLIYPFLIVDLRPAYKVMATAVLSAAAFIFTGLFKTKTLVFAGIVCGSLSQGLGEPVFVSAVRIYGDSSFIGWSIGTGMAGILGATIYALLKIFFSVKVIMMIMLSMPISLLLAYFCIIKPVSIEKSEEGNDLPNNHVLNVRHKEIREKLQDDWSSADIENQSPFNFKAKLYHMPNLMKYFAPLILVYFSEYFINMGMFELIYYPETTYLDHAGQYLWFQVAYQLGVFISRCSLDFFVIKKIWTMSILQALNVFLFLAHVFRLISIPSFYVCYLLIVYEGLLGGFTYINTFFRIKDEVRPEKQEFSISVTTVADSLGIVAAGLAAVPFHNALCNLYNWITLHDGNVRETNFSELIKIYEDTRR